MDKTIVDNGVKLILALFKGKEKPKIIGCLKNGPLRFSELQKQITPISKKVLTDQLRKLEEAGLIQRTVIVEPNNHVEYSITPLLAQAQPLFNEIKKWEDYYRENYSDYLVDDLENVSKHPFDLIINILGDKWKPEIIYSLHDGKKRFGEIKKELFPISQRVLTQHLRDLERYGFISRVIHDNKILHVEYSLTDLCYTFKNIGIETVKYYQHYLHWKEKSPLN